MFKSSIVELAVSQVSHHLANLDDEVIRKLSDVTNDDVFGLKYVNDYGDCPPLIAFYNKFYDGVNPGPILNKQYGAFFSALFRKVFGYSQVLVKHRTVNGHRVSSPVYVKTDK